MTKIQANKGMDLIKSDIFLYIVGFIVMYLFAYVYNQIDYHNMMKHAVISEAALVRKFKLGGWYYYRYSYRTSFDEYEGLIGVSKFVSIGDTIMIVYDQQKNKKSRAIRLRKGKAIISNEYKKYVIVNNKTKDEKKEIADRLMTELKERYHANE